MTETLRTSYLPEFFILILYLSSFILGASYTFSENSAQNGSINLENGVKLNYFNFFWTVLLNNLLAGILIIAGGWLFCIPTLLVPLASGYFAGLYFGIAYRAYGPFISLILYIPMPLEIIAIVILGHVSFELCRENLKRLRESDPDVPVLRSHIRPILIGIFLIVIGAVIETIIQLYTCWP